MQAQGHAHVLSICVLRYYFARAGSGEVVYEEDGYSVEEARSLGLRPLLAQRIAFDGAPYAAIRVALLDDGMPMWPLLAEVWSTESDEFKGPPAELLVDQWLIDALPDLGQGLQAVGCVPRTDIGRKKVAGSKGVTQRHRFYVDDGAMTVDSINKAERKMERWRWDFMNEEAIGWRHRKSGVIRRFPSGVVFGPCVLRETPALWDKVPPKTRPQRDLGGDLALENALQTLQRCSRIRHDETSRAKMLRRGTGLLVDALKTDLDEWAAGLSWLDGAYMYAGTGTGCVIVRLRVGEPCDPSAQIFNRPERLPERWPRLNDGTSTILGFGVGLLVCDLGDLVELTVEVVVEGPGRWWIKDAMNSSASSTIASQIRKGKFRVEWQDLGQKSLRDGWQDLTTTLSDGQVTSELCLERRFRQTLRIDEVRQSMRDAAKLVDTLWSCAAEVWRHEPR